MEPTEAIKEIGISELEDSLNSLSEKDWEGAGWPLVSSASKESYANSLNSGAECVRFWEQVLNKKNYIIPGVQNTYNPEKDNLFIVHSFKNDNNDECIFKAITTSLELFVKDPKHMINYNYHGGPCEGRSRNVGGKGSTYPRCDFWNDFYDKLSEDKLGAYPIPTKELRKSFIQKNLFKK